MTKNITTDDGMSEELNKICYEEGKNLYLQLRQKYPEISMRDFDIITNSLCMALMCMASHTSNKSNYVRLITKILQKNLKSC